MLKKRLKYDFKAQFRLLWPLYAAVILLSFGIRAYDFLESWLNWGVFHWKIVDVFVGFYTLLYVFSLIGLFIWTIIVCVRDFYISMLKDEGYLTHTLPVSENILFLSKELISVLALICSSCIFIISIFIVFGGTFWFIVFLRIFQYIFNNEGGPYFILFMIIVIGSMISGSYASITLYYLSMMLGQLHRSSKGILAVAYYFLISFGMQILGVIALSFLGILDPSIYYMMDRFTIAYPILSALLLFMGIVAYNILIGIIMHVIGVWIAEHKLNLD